MNAHRKLAIVAVAFAGTLAAAAAQAHGRDDVQLSFTIGAPFVPSPPVYAPAPVFVPAPAARYERDQDRRDDGRHEGRATYRAPSRWDVDGDGIPNRYDRVDNRKRGFR